MISTVTGEIDESKIGVTSPHEHIFIDMRMCVPQNDNPPKYFYDKISTQNRVEVASDPYAILDNALLDEKDYAIEELEYFKEWGGQTIIDCTPDEIGRNPEALRDISQKTGVNIILGCGHYYDISQPEYLKKAKTEDIAQEMINDITVGIGNTGIKAGIIGEIGTSAYITDTERKVLTAAGIAGNETKKAIHIHTDLYTENGFDIINTLVKEGVKPEKICIDHIDVWLRPDYIKALLDKGVYVEFDNFGKEFYVSEKRRFAYDLERIKLLRILIEQGYQDKILISNDICLKTMWKRYGGQGYAHVLRDVMYMAQENGINEKTYIQFFTKNVINFIK